MKTYNALNLNVIAEDKFRANKGMSYKEASAAIGVCSLTAVFVKNDQDVVVDKERVWMTPGGAWVKTSGYADVGTVKGTYEGVPVIREAKFNRVKAVTLEEAVNAIGACSLAKVALCDADGNMIKQVQPESYDADSDDGNGYRYAYDACGRMTEKDGELSHELVWLSLSGTYWARISGNIDENVGLTL